jgi:hypothetical protein
MTRTWKEIHDDKLAQTKALQTLIAGWADARFP